MKKQLINKIVNLWEVTEDANLFPPQQLADEIRHLHTLNIKQLREYLRKETN
jgi:hypothetical protein